MTNRETKKLSNITYVLHKSDFIYKSTKTRKNIAFGLNSKPLVLLN